MENFSVILSWAGVASIIAVGGLLLKLREIAKEKADDKSAQDNIKRVTEKNLKDIHDIKAVNSGQNEQLLKTAMLLEHVDKTLIHINDKVDSLYTKMDLMNNGMVEINTWLKAKGIINGNKEENRRKD